MATINGTAVNFGVSGTTVTGTGVGTMFLQKADRERKAQVDATLDEDGEMAARAHYQFSDAATLEWKVKGSNLSDAYLQTKIPNPGAFITIVSSKDPDLAGTKWEAQSGAKVSRTNTTTAVISCPLEKWAGITTTN